MRRRRLFPLAFLLLVAPPLFAQQFLDPSLLPARTIFYVVWHGAPSADVRHANAVMSLWDDPDSAQLRTSLVQTLLTDTKKPKNTLPLTKEELNEYASLLDNSFLAGYLPRPADLPVPKPAIVQPTAVQSTPTTTVPAWNGMFFVYDRTGKETLLSRAILRLRGSETDIPKLTNLIVAGVPALKLERKSSVSYWTENGKYAVSANELPVFEEILERLAGTSKGPSLVDSTTYLEAKPLLTGGIAELFVGVPQISDLATESAASNPQLKALFKSLKFDAFHVLAGHLSLEGPKTRVQGALLGDTSSGTLFDIWADGKANPDALRFLSANTISFNESQINFLGIYNVIKQAFSQGANSSPQMVDALESAAQTRLGMPLADALSLTTGEVSSIQNSAVMDDYQQIRLLGIRNKPDAMKLLRTIMGDKIISERNEGTTTYMKISLAGTPGSAGVAQWNFYHLAMTPDFLLGASKSEPLQALLAQQAADHHLAAAKDLLTARSKFPEKLNGFSYFNFQKVDWPAASEKWIAEAKTAAAKAKTTDNDTSKKLYDRLATVNFEVFPRHLHSMTGASWKDAKGVHFDEWIE
jgi:hypothetical protein